MEIMQQENRPILAQKLARLIVASPLMRAVAILVLPFIGVVAAFGFAPDTVTDPATRKAVVEPVALPLVVHGPAAEDGYWREAVIERGDRIADLLKRIGVDDPEAMATLSRTRSARTLYQLIPGRAVRARTTVDGKLQELRYRVGTTVLSVTRADGEFRIQEAPAELERRVQMSSGEISSSLFAATDSAGLSDSIAIQIADIFSTDIDFHRDLRRGDRFAVVYEVFYDRGEPAKSGRVLATEFVNQGRAYRAVYFASRDGRGGYYTPEGKNIRKAFLRSPLEFSRITSGFTNSRYHPILKRWRAHMGIDYGAPVGTRVRATGDGVVEFAGRHSGGYGNLVVLRHRSSYTTWYGHLSGFAKGIRRGARVAQGDAIGYVGATGLATGPHLHYEFRINNVHQNPLRIVLPAAPPIQPGQKAAFDAVAAPLIDQLDVVRGMQFARLD